MEQNNTMNELDPHSISPKPLLDRCISLINLPDAYAWALGIYGSKERIERGGLRVDTAAYDAEAYESAKDALRQEAEQQGVNFDDTWNAAQAWYDAMKIAHS